MIETFVILSSSLVTQHTSASMEVISIWMKTEVMEVDESYSANI